MNAKNSAGLACLITAMAMGVTAASPLAAKDKSAPPPPPKVLTDLLACRQIADPQARLACFDTQTATLAGATERSDIVVAERKEVERAQRDLFGYAVPSSPILGSASGQEQAKRLETKVAAARRGRDGGWIITMAESGVWEQTDSKPLALSPKPGQKVVITKGALGSFFVSVDGQPAIKMRRIQ